MNGRNFTGHWVALLDRVTDFRDDAEACKRLSAGQQEMTFGEDPLRFPNPHEALSYLVESDEPLSEPSSRLLHQLLKVFKDLFKTSFFWDSINRDSIGGWMVLSMELVKRGVPESLQRDLTPRRRSQLIWWRVIGAALEVMFEFTRKLCKPERLAGLEQVSLARWFHVTFAQQLTATCDKILDDYMHNDIVYVTPDAVDMALEFFCEIVASGSTLIEFDLSVIYERVVFKRLTFGAAEDELLARRDSYLITRDLLFRASNFGRSRRQQPPEPLLPAQRALLVACCVTDMQRRLLRFLARHISAPRTPPRTVEACLNMLGTIAPSILKMKRPNEAQIENLLMRHVFSEHLKSQHRFIRARAIWVLSCYASLPFNRPEHVRLLAKSMISSLLLDAQDDDDNNNDEEPQWWTKVEATLCLWNLMQHQTKLLGGETATTAPGHTPSSEDQLIQENYANLVRVIMHLFTRTRGVDLFGALEDTINFVPDKMHLIVQEVIVGLSRMLQPHGNGPTGPLEPLEEGQVLKFLVSLMERSYKLGDDEALKHVLEDCKPVVADIYGRHNNASNHNITHSNNNYQLAGQPG